MVARRRADHRFMTAVGRCADRGSVTAELAAALPALMVFATVALGAVDAVTQKLECVDAARDGALAAARGGDGAAAARPQAPAGASVAVQIDGDVVRSRVAVTIHPLGRFGPGIEVAGTAAAEVEPGAGT
jgi:hypothetical protein